MKTYMKKIFGTVLIGFLGITFCFGISQADETSVAGIYQVVEMNGKQIPARSWVENPHGERCEKIVLEGALLLDSEGRSAAFITEQVICPSKDGSATDGEKKSLIFPGSYTVSGNQITLQDDFGTDRAVIKGDVLVYKTGGGDRPIEEYILRREL
jgi:hypothetical protein